jgi:tRNA(Ile)-lysidine synthase
MQLLARVRQTIRQHDLAGSATRVVIALSGGADSVALTHLLLALDAEKEMQVAGLAHFNHQLRPGADGDEQFCGRVADSVGRPLLVDRADVGALARRDGHSIENAAREARHEFFERARRHFKADVVALGHTRDDQAETFLLRLLRGAGARGLASMHPRRDAVVRPLLDCRRSDLRLFLSERGIAFIHDESNDDVSVPRNRVRAELMPFLQERFNPSIVDALADEAAVAREDWRWMEAECAGQVKRLCRRDGRVCRIDAAALNALPTALGRLVLQRALSETAGGRAVSFAHDEEALRLSRSAGRPVDLPGQRMERNGPDVVLTGRPVGAAGRPVGRLANPSNFFRYPLSIPGEILIAATGGLLSAEVAPSAPGPSAGLANSPNAPADGAVAVVQFNHSLGPIAVRNRRPGDRFRPLGLSGGKKLQDFFVDRRVARDRRDQVPLVVDQSDQIIWVAGYGIDERFRVMDPAQAVVVLRLRQV